MAHNTTVLLTTCTCGMKFTPEQIIDYNNNVINDRGNNQAGIEYMKRLIDDAKGNEGNEEYADIRNERYSDIKLCCLLTVRTYGPAYNDMLDNKSDVGLSYSSGSMIKVIKQSLSKEKNLSALGNSKISSNKLPDIPRSGTPGITINGFMLDASGNPLTVPCGNAKVKVLNITTDYDPK